MKEPKTLNDIAFDLQRSIDELEQLMCKPGGKGIDDLSFEHKVLLGARNIIDGNPLKDVMSIEEIEKAICMLSDILITTGVRVPDDYY